MVLKKLLVIHSFVCIFAIPNILNMEAQELKQEILRLKKEKNAVILGHYYQRDEIQEVSDFVGDSLALAQEARRTECDIIVFCGVHFMAETAKILNPEKKVLLPDMEANCSLARSCPADAFSKFKQQYPDHMVISYVNCSAEIKALSDLICTSGNAEKLVNALPKDQKIIFAPDKNLGGYINRQTGRDMVLWDGTCTVHDALNAEAILKMKLANPDAPVVAHPECNSAVLHVSDFIGSTKAMLTFIKNSPAKRFIIATESGILFEMRQQFPDREFLSVSAKEGCACLECADMKLNTLEKLYNCILNENPEVNLSKDMIQKAEKPIIRMLDMSKQLGIIK